MEQVRLAHGGIYEITYGYLSLWWYAFFIKSE